MKTKKKKRLKQCCHIVNDYSDSEVIIFVCPIYGKPAPCYLIKKDSRYKNSLKCKYYS